MSIYDPLQRFLSTERKPTIRISFNEIEELLARKLPRSAYLRPAWWSNNTTGHSHARSWVDAGWRAEKVDLEKRVLVFSRNNVIAGARARAGSALDPFGAMRGSVTISPGVDLTEPTGEWFGEAELPG